MANIKDELGKPSVDGNTYTVGNGANQPREFKIRGKWHRWEPAGFPGDIVILTKDEIESQDFISVSYLFSVKGA